MEEITIDPKMFINKPYTECPNCHGQNFGVLGIHRHHYIKRCADCRYDEKYPLPVLTRRVIYLDQFVISNMMKSINKVLGEKEKVDPLYLELFKKLDRLNKLQLIVCPDSPIQDKESRVSRNYKELKRMFEQLSHGTSFHRPDTVRRFQVHSLFRRWVGKEVEPLDVFDFIRGNSGIDGWDSRLIVSVSSDMSESDIQNIRDEKAHLSEAMNEIVDMWKREKGSFRDFYDRELNSFGPSILKRYIIDLGNYLRSMSLSEDSTDLLLASVLSEISVLMTAIHNDLKELGCEDENLLTKTAEFFNSDLIKEAPYAIISSILYASLAGDYANGRKTYPSPGFFDDVGMIAGYAPYCDAMFIDKECRRLLIHNEAIPIYDLSNRVFSLDNRGEFMNYLNCIEKDMPKEHADLVHRVYGEDWPKPFLEMYEV